MSLDGHGTLVDQLVRALRGEIEKAHVGARLPPTRSLAQDLGVSRNTVITAYGELDNEGLITTRFGAGSFVSRLTSVRPVRKRADAAADETRIEAVAKRPRLSRAGQRLENLDPSPILERAELEFDFRYGLPIVGAFPFNTWSRIVARRAMMSATSMLGYGEAAGYQPLRTELAEYLRRARGVVCDADQIIITNGSQQALDLIARVLVNPGDRVILEEPAYEGAREVFQVSGARIDAVPVDKHGLQVDRLPGGSTPCRIVYVTPSHQFPTGAVLSADRRRKLLKWAQRQGCFVIEDDYDGELRYDIRPLEAIKAAEPQEQVIYIGTMSKVLFPSLRLGYLVSPLQLVKALVAAKHVTDRQTAFLLQTSLSDFMAQGHFNRHLLRAKRLCAHRRRALLEAIDQHLGPKVSVTGANAGIHVMMSFNARSTDDVERVIARSADVGVGIYPIAPYYLHAPRRAGLLLGYASMEADMIREGIKRLAAVIESVKSSGLSPEPV